MEDIPKYGEEKFETKLTVRVLKAAGI